MHDITPMPGMRFRPPTQITNVAMHNRLVGHDFRLLNYDFNEDGISEVILDAGYTLDMRDRATYLLILDQAPSKESGMEPSSVNTSRFGWTFHNMIAHPLMELLNQLGFSDLGERIHNWSIPKV